MTYAPDILYVFSLDHPTVERFFLTLLSFKKYKKLFFGSQKAKKPLQRPLVIKSRDRDLIHYVVPKTHQHILFPSESSFGGRG